MALLLRNGNRRFRDREIIRPWVWDGGFAATALHVFVVVQRRALAPVQKETVQDNRKSCDETNKFKKLQHQVFFIVPFVRICVLAPLYGLDQVFLSHTYIRRFLGLVYVSIPFFSSIPVQFYGKLVHYQLLHIT